LNCLKYHAIEWNLFVLFYLSRNLGLWSETNILLTNLLFFSFSR